MLMMKLVTVAEMQAIEREANASGLSYAQMMENAGVGLAEVVQDEFGYLAEEGVLGLVGSGNNGGDALVALAHLAQNGWRTAAYLLRDRQPDDPLLGRFSDTGGKLWVLAEDENFSSLDQLLAEHAVLLDGVLGTGASLPLKPPLANTLDHIRQYRQEHDLPQVVVAVDCPSGVDCDSGEAAPQTLPADLTVTMAAVKAGLMSFPAHELAGEIRLVGIGLTDDQPAWKTVQCTLAEADAIRELLPERPSSAHKGTFGTVIVLAGSASYTGAALLAGKAAYRVGAGLVTLAVPSLLHTALAGHFPEATWILLPEEAGCIAAPAVDVLAGQLERATALLIGPGFGLQPTTRDFLAGLLGSGVDQDESDKQAKVRLPRLVIDADGLKLLSQLPDWPDLLPEPAILTPHPGEMAALTGLDTAAIQRDRLRIAGRYAHKWQQIVVLKGANTIISAPDGRTIMIPVATAALARAGSGDVLAGAITGLLAQGLEPFAAAAAGTWLHAQAGVIAGDRLGNSASVLAGDLLDGLIEAINDLA